MTVAARPSVAVLKLPVLRQDLRIVGDATDLGGQRYWKIYDPLSHRFTALSRMHIAMLDAWPDARTADEIVEAVWRSHAQVVTSADVAAFAQFLIANGLATSPDPGGWRQTFASTERLRAQWLWRIIKGYLFVKISLVDPERFLRATLPFVRPFGSRASLVTFALLLVVAVALVLREWDQFASSAVRLASWSGALEILPAVVFVKLLHELAHGYVAMHFGCRVQSLGVAFMVGAPMLFVDVTDSWKIKSTRRQLAIDGAGVGMDLAVSILSTLAWVFLPDGPGRSVAFNLATAGWLTSLMFNLNPFMKFDGYHMLADAIGMPNMQTRAMALSRWSLRESLFDLKAPPPEGFEPHVMRWLVAYGFAVWIYRTIIFVGIALVVYAFFFKLLGIVLFLVEIVYFILGPFWKELMEWYRMRQRIFATRRTLMTLAALAAVLLLLATPWSSTVRIPAVLEPGDLAEVHVPVPSRLTAVEVRGGASVSKGAPMYRLASAELDHELRAATLQAKIIDLRLDRLMSDAKDREQAVVLRQERSSLARKIDGVRGRMAELQVAAPIEGVVASTVEYPGAGRWVTPSEPLVVIHRSGRMRIRGLVDASDRDRVRSGMEAVFVPNNLLAPSVRAVVAAVADVNVATVDQVALAQSFGGSVPTLLDKKGGAAPVSPQYQVIAEIEDSAWPPADVGLQSEAGVLLAKGDPQSIFQGVWRRALMVLVRESGF